MESNVRVGKVKDAHSLKGELYILLFAKKADWADALEQFTLVDPVTSAQKNYQIESYRPHKDGLIIKVEGVKDRTAAEKLKNFLFEIPKAILTSEPGEPMYLAEVEGFDVYQGAQFIGQITSFGSNGFQDLLCVEDADYVYEIPFVADYVVHMNFIEKKIEMELPEDLLTLCRTPR